MEIKVNIKLKKKEMSEPFPFSHTSSNKPVSKSDTSLKKKTLYEYNNPKCLHT